MDAKTHPNQSTSQTLSRLPAMLFWFEIKLLLWFQTSFNSNVSARKRCHPIWHLLCCSTKCLQNGLWCKENVNSSFDHVILHEMISSAQPYRSLWPTNSAKAKWAQLCPITCACSALVWTPNFHTPFQAHVIPFTHKLLTSSAFQVATTLNST
jgi:hypothetical protein